MAEFNYIFSKFGTFNCILKKFIGIPTLEIGYAYTQDNIYRAPGETDTVEQLKAYIDGLPNEDAPEVFGMNSNAQLAAQKKEMNSLIDTLAMVAPKSAGGGGARGFTVISRKPRKSIIFQGLDQRLFHVPTEVPGISSAVALV